MEQLIKEGSIEALIGVFKRFTIVATKSIEDEEEKGWAYRQLSGLGSEVLPAARQFCLESDNIAWALRIIEDAADETEEWEILDALIARHPPEYERDPSAKLQLLTHLADIEDPHVPAILSRYLEDPDEGVRYFAAEQLLDIGNESSRSALVARLCNPAEDSLRLRNRLLDGLAHLRWDIHDHVDDIAAIIGDDHALRDGKVVRR